MNVTASAARLARSNNAGTRIAWVLSHAIGIDARIGLLATLQHGIVTWGQLLRLGIAERSIRHRLTTGRLHKIHRGVYAVGHRALTNESRWTAAVFAVDPGALSHFAAGSAWRFIDAGGPIHVSSERPRRSRRGLVIHRAVLPPEDLAIVEGIDVTSVERTLLDLSQTTGERRLRSWVREAEFRELTDAARLASALDRHPRRRGRRNLCRVVEQLSFGKGVTRSELERLFLDFLRERGLPEPALNVEIQVDSNSFVLDCLWRDFGLVVELDGRSAHAEGGRHDRDTWRDRKLLLGGLETIRVTWRQLVQAPDELERDLRAAFSQRQGSAFTAPMGRPIDVAEPVGLR